MDFCLSNMCLALGLQSGKGLSTCFFRVEKLSTEFTEDQTPKRLAILEVTGDPSKQSIAPWLLLLWGAEEGRP